MATLATYYDEIWFPYPFNWDPDATVTFRPMDADDPLHESIQLRHKEYVDWKRRYRSLFAEGIVKILPPPFQSGHAPPDLKDKVGPVIQHQGEGVVNSMSVLMGMAPLAVHLFYARKPSPELFVHGDLEAPGNNDEWLAGFVQAYWPKGKPNPHQRTQQIIAHLIRSLFRLTVPGIPNLPPENFFALRQKLRRFKEGFSDFTTEMTEAVRTTVGEEFVDDEDAAFKVAKVKIEPRFHEFKRKFTPELAGVVNRVGQGIAGIFTIDVTPTTPKFYGELLQPVFGLTGPVLTAGEALKSNENQAYLYLGSLERSARKLARRT
jgi:hypothetical protein